MPLAPDTPRSVRQGRTGRPWERLKASVFAEETHCWVCHTYVDQDLWPGHPMSRTVDHVNPLGKRGAPLERSNCRLAHRRCNTARSNRLRRRTKQRDQLTVDLSTI